MASIRHQSYLDAALENILEVGWRRTTLTDVARRAGVSRMTIYRAWPSMATMLGDLMTREAGQLLAGVRLAAEPTPDTIADSVVGLVRGLRENPLFRQMRDREPELMVPYVFERPGRTGDTLLEVLDTQVRRGQQSGAVRAGDPEALTHAVYLTGLGFAMAVGTVTRDEAEVERLDALLAIQVRATLTPEPESAG